LRWAAYIPPRLLLYNDTVVCVQAEDPNVAGSHLAQAECLSEVQTLLREIKTARAEEFYKKVSK
jgi:hypothetical protein